MGIFRRKQRSLYPARWALEQGLLNFSARANPWTIADACEGCLILGATGSAKTTGSGRTVALSFLKASGRNYFPCSAGLLGVIVMSYFGSVAERCRRASICFISLAATRTPSG